jgi:hypothetical protein
MTDVIFHDNRANAYIPRAFFREAGKYQRDIICVVAVLPHAYRSESHPDWDPPEFQILMEHPIGAVEQTEVDVVVPIVVFGEPSPIHYVLGWTNAGKGKEVKENLFEETTVLPAERKVIDGGQFEMTSMTEPVDHIVIPWGRVVQGPLYGPP